MSALLLAINSLVRLAVSNVVFSVSKSKYSVDKNWIGYVEKLRRPTPQAKACGLLVKGKMGRRDGE